MSSNPYKAFIAYSIHKYYGAMSALRLPDEIEQFKSRDPSGGQWASIGFAETFEGDLVTELSSARSLMVVQFNERILPAKVRDEKVKAKVAKLQDQEGRKISKKEYAQLREEVEFELLPKAFIRRSQVPVFFSVDGTMLVCTGSQSKADKTVAFLAHAFEHLEPWQIQVARATEQSLTLLAKADIDDEIRGFRATNSALLKGDGKRSIRIKDRDIGSQEVQALLDDYRVHELGIETYDGVSGDIELSFSVNDNFVFKRCTLPDVKATGLKDDQHGYALLCAQTYLVVYHSLLRHFGGALPKPVDSSNDATTQDEEL